MNEIVQRRSKLRDDHRKALLDLNEAFERWKSNLARQEEPIVDVSALAEEDRRLRKLVKEMEEREQAAMMEWLRFAVAHQDVLKSESSRKP